MKTENSCIFCQSQLSGESVCEWCGFSQQPKAHISGTLAFGTKLGDYVIGDVMDMDGESTTYSAYDTESQQKVLIKEFLPVSIVAPREENNVKVQQGKEVLYKNLLMDFTDLYSTLSKIENKSIQKVLEIFTANNTVYTVLECIKGDTLRQNLIKRGKTYSFKEARWMFQDLFVLLSELEKLNIAHGGISDETVLVTPDNNLVLTGFAIADLRVKNEHIMYKLYEGFSAPEQYKLNEFSGFYTDIYSVSALLYHIVTGRLFDSKSLELKDLPRFMPKYAVEALKHATKPNPLDRIDNIQDFVLMLDNKATIEKPEKKENKKTTAKIQSNKIIIGAMAVVIFVRFIAAMFSINSGETSSVETPPSSSEPESSQVTQLKVPKVIGKTYSEVMNDSQYTQYFYFNVSEEHDKAPVGQIIKQQPNENAIVNQGTIIYVTVSKGPEKVKVQIPYGIVGRPLSEAEALLDTMGIKYFVKEVPQTRQYPYNTVASLSLPEGTMIDADTMEIFVYVSDNTPVAQRPNE